MNSAVDRIARAVLYEGYLLYPYRRSSLKNRQRWNFGVLYPPAWAARQGGPDRAYLQMECLARCAGECGIRVALRFLQLTGIESAAEEREVLAEGDGARRFVFGAVEGLIESSVSPVREGLFRLTVRVTNTSRGAVDNRDDALLLSLASAHIVVTIGDGELISQTDPPDDLKADADRCQNTGVWPVLVGAPGATDTMLGSPIILCDYPQIAPESGGDLFDGAEIDEILTLRVLTLTDDEKDELRRGDERARRLLERLEAAPEDHLLNLHGRTRVAKVKKGDRVRLRPRKRADLFDTLLAGKIAIVEAVEEDFEGQIHVAVVVEDDPGRDFGEMRQAGHRFFYGLDEIEPEAG